jgi:ribonuclease BN (tRNA processing enzyme)
MNKLTAALCIFAIVTSGTACAQTDSAEGTSQNQFITLGTAGGPEADVNRAQPANALAVNGDLYLVDAGDGAAGQLIKAGFRLPALNGIFISHNHFDHTGGVMAVLGLRMQLNARNRLKIYGPPGTKALIDGLLAGMDHSMEAAYGMPGQSWNADIDVQELTDDSIIELDGLTVTVAENTHFKIPENSGAAEKAKSLSFRFDMEDRSIVYTGDTGPSEAVEKLAQNADLLISEMMDIPEVLEGIRNINPNMPQQQFDGIEWHLRAHHLLPSQVGEMAHNAGVGKVIVTHMAPSIKSNKMSEKYRTEIARSFDGDVVFANDLDGF